MHIMTSIFVYVMWIKVQGRIIIFIFVSIFSFAKFWISKNWNRKV